MKCHSNLNDLTLVYWHIKNITTKVKEKYRPGIKPFKGFSFISLY